MSDTYTRIHHQTDGWYFLTLVDPTGVRFVSNLRDRQSALAFKADVDDALQRLRCAWCNDTAFGGDTGFIVVGDLDNQPDDFIYFCSAACDADATEYDHQELIRG